MVEQAAGRSAHAASPGAMPRSESEPVPGSGSGERARLRRLLRQCGQNNGGQQLRIILYPSALPMATNVEWRTPVIGTIRLASFAGRCSRGCSPRHLES